MSSEFNPTAKLLAHPQHVAAFIAHDWQQAPVSVEILPTNECNAVCPWCFFADGAQNRLTHVHGDRLDYQALQRCLQDLAYSGVESVVWSGGGEPSIYEHIDTAIDLAADLGLKQGIFTNAYKAIRSPKKLQWVRITITEKHVITKHVEEYAKKTKVGVNFNLCAENQSQLLPMLLQARAAGASYFQVRPALAENWRQQMVVEMPENLLLYQTPEFRVMLTPYKFDDYLKPHGYKHCHGHRIVPTIHANGDVATCAYHFQKEPFTFGNITRESWSAIWSGERRQKMLYDGIEVIDACQHCCKLHETNKALSTLAGDPALLADVEFA